MTTKNSRKGASEPRSHVNASDPGLTLNPGDEALPGTPGTGEDVCSLCHGQGRVNRSPCPNCGGTGKIVKAIGGA